MVRNGIRCDWLQNNWPRLFRRRCAVCPLNDPSKTPKTKGRYSLSTEGLLLHYDDVKMTTTASQITNLTVVYSTVYSDADQRKYQSSASLAIVWGIHRSRWIPRTKGQLRRKCFHLMTSSCKYSRTCCTCGVSEMIYFVLYGLLIYRDVGDLCWPQPILLPSKL